jgi:hypothetical protein
MTQGVLPFKYEEEKKDSGMTSLGGLPIYLDLASAMRLPDMNSCVYGKRHWPYCLQASKKCVSVLLPLLTRRTGLFYRGWTKTAIFGLKERDAKAKVTG